MVFISFAGIATGVCIALYGWGLLFHRIAKRPVENRAMTVTIGLGAIIFLGGVFNLLRFAYGWVFDGMLIIGVVLAAKYGKLGPKLPRSKGEWFHIVILGLLIAVIMGFTVKTQLPPKAFNWHDDLEKYFAHPVRMLQTGTLFGSPLSTLGSSTLGGLAVLHGIVLNHFPIPYINGVDAVFGLLLCLILSVSVVPLRAIFLPISLIGLLIVFFINPQYVNVSALYIGSALMMASILLFSHIHEYENKKTENLPHPILTGLIYAALIVLKSTFVVFPLLHLSSSIIALKLFGVDFRRLFRWSLSTAGLTFLFLLPWLLLHLPHYMHATAVQTPRSTTIAPEEYPNLLSSNPLYYGASFAHYTFISIAIALPVFGIIWWKRRERIQSGRTALAGLAASGFTIVAAYLLIIGLGPLLSGYGTGLRYTIPFLIAGAPIILSLVYLWAIMDKSFGFKLSFSATALFLGALILVSFSKSLTDRIHQACESGSILAFSKLAAIPEYIAYNEEVIYGDTRLRIAAAQEQIPQGQAAVVLINEPFYLDYKRNIIFDVDPAGTANPWTYMPNVDYFMLEYKGLAVRASFDTWLGLTQFPARNERSIAEKYIAFLESLKKIGQNADEIYNDGRIVVFKKHRK
jgi:hypothetical protein